MSSAYWQAEARFDWRRYVEGHGGEPASRRIGSEYLLECPQCGKKKLAVNVQRRAWRCFVCGDGGRDASSLVTRIEGIRWHEALDRILSGGQRSIGHIDSLDLRLGGSLEDRLPSWAPAPRAYPEGFVQIPNASAFGIRAEEYLMKRAISLGVAERMGLGFCVGGRFHDRLIFPVKDPGTGALLFWQGRAMWESMSDRFLKVLGASSADERHAGSGDVLLNLDRVASTGYSRVAVVEGPVDCAHAFPDAVAAFGKHVSARQVELLIRAGVREIDLCFDEDALETAQKQASVLSDIFVVRVVQLPSGRDPGDLEYLEIRSFRDRAPIWGTGDRLNRLSLSLQG